MLNECNGCEYKCSLSHIDICTLGSPCPHQRSTPMTKEEWLHTLNTEQLAEEISHLVFGGDFKKHISKMGYINMHSFKTEIAEWLKQPHKPIS